jgi:hypothetical protein
LIVLRTLAAPRARFAPASQAARGAVKLGLEPDIAVVVADEGDWPDGGPYGLPFFRNATGEIRAGVVVMPGGGGDFSERR